MSKDEGSLPTAADASALLRAATRFVRCELVQGKASGCRKVGGRTGCSCPTAEQPND